MRLVILTFVALFLSGCGVGLCVIEKECSPSPWLDDNGILISGYEIEANRLTVQWPAPKSGVGPFEFRIYQGTATSELATLEQLNGLTPVATVTDAYEYSFSGLASLGTTFAYNVVGRDKFGVPFLYSPRQLFCGGDGTASAPYEICDCGSLQAMNQFLGARYKLAQDVDCRQSAQWNTGKGFYPIGNCGIDNLCFTGDDVPFTGALDGATFSIRGLTIARPTRVSVGMFGLVQGSPSISSIALVETDIEGQVYVGALAGTLRNSLMSDVQISGEVTGLDFVGGLIGFWGTPGLVSTCTRCHSSANVSGNDLIGGLFGVWDGGTLTLQDSSTTGNVSGAHGVGGVVGEQSNGGMTTNVFSSGNISGTTMVGGIAGYSYTATRSRIYATGNITGTNQVGGLYGNLEQGTISQVSFRGSVAGTSEIGGIAGYRLNLTPADCYVTGSVSGTAEVGGIVGHSDSNTLTRCLMLGAVSGSTEVGALVGFTFINPNTFSYNYWNSDTVGVANGVGYFTGTGLPVASSANAVEPRTTAQLRQSATFTTWTFPGIWSIVENVSYPTLTLSP